MFWASKPTDRSPSFNQHHQSNISHSYINIEHLYSAISRKLLRDAHKSSVGKSFKVKTEHLLVCMGKRNKEEKLFRRAERVEHEPLALRTGQHGHYHHGHYHQLHCHHLFPIWPSDLNKINHRSINHLSIKHQSSNQSSSPSSLLHKIIKYEKLSDFKQIIRKLSLKMNAVMNAIYESKWLPL